MLRRLELSAWPPDIYNSVTFLLGYCLFTLAASIYNPGFALSGAALGLLGVVALIVAIPPAVLRGGAYIRHLIGQRRPPQAPPYTHPLVPRSWSVLFVAILAYYCGGLVLPAYLSGFYALTPEERWRSGFSISLYTEPYVALAAGMALIAVVFVLIPLIGGVLVRLALGWHTARPIERLGWLSFVIAVAAALWLTLGVAASFSSWVFD